MGVSTAEQDLTAQRDALASLGVEPDREVNPTPVFDKLLAAIYHVSTRTSTF